MIKYMLLALTALIPSTLLAEQSYRAEDITVTEWKAVFGKVEARDNVPARSRLGGTIVSVTVVEGSHVEKGQQIAVITDEKLQLQLRALDASLSSLTAQLENAEAELARGENLLKRGVTTAQNLDRLRTQVDVIKGQIDATNADRDVLEQRQAEGSVLAPISGTVLNVPVTEGSVILQGEVVAQIGGGGFFLRLAVPERHAGVLKEGAKIHIGTSGAETTGTLAKIYPLIENGRVIADVEVEGLDTDFVAARVLVRLPIGERSALLVPADTVITRMGLDFVTVDDASGPMHRAVVLGARHQVDGSDMVEILSGLSAGETVMPNHE